MRLRVEKEREREKDPTCFGPERCQLVLVSFQSSEFKWRREQETELEQCEEEP